MHSMDNYYVSKLIPLIVEAGVHAIQNPLINMMLQCRNVFRFRRLGYASSSRDSEKHFQRNEIVLHDIKPLSGKYTLAGM